MARIAGINIPLTKHVVIALTSIYGIGNTRAQQICSAAGIDPATPVKDLAEPEVALRRGEGGAQQRRGHEARLRRGRLVEQHDRPIPGSLLEREGRGRRQRRGVARMTELEGAHAPLDLREPGGALLGATGLLPTITQVLQLDQHRLQRGVGIPGVLDGPERPVGLAGSEEQGGGQQGVDESHGGEGV